MNAPEHILNTEGPTAMESKLRRRLDELRAEFDKGRQTLHELEGQAGNVRATLLRISGAIQVLSEALGEPVPDGVVLAPPPRLPPG